MKHVPIPPVFHRKRFDRAITPVLVRYPKHEWFEEILFKSQYAARLLTEGGLMGMTCHAVVGAENQFVAALEAAYDQMDALFGERKKLTMCSTNHQNHKILIYHNTSDVDLHLAEMVFTKNPIENIRLEVYRMPTL